MLGAEPLTLAALFTPLGILLALAWNFAVLASVQLTVRLIRAFSVVTTALGALLMTPAFLLVCWIYGAWLGSRLDLFPLAVAFMGACGYAAARWVLRVRRERGRLVAAVGIGLLSAPWPVFLMLPPR